MTAGKSSRISEHKQFLLIVVFIVLTYVTDGILDAILENEDLYKQMFSPIRLLSLIIIAAAAFYVLRLQLKHFQLKKSFRLHHKAMEASIDGIAIFDAESGLVYSNPAHTRLFGYDNEEEILGKEWRFFYGEEEVKNFYHEVKPALMEHGEWRGETTGTRKDGSQFPQEISLTRLRDRGVVRIVRDITEKRNYQTELERKARALAVSNRELETFSYTLSHDMRSYITRISSAAQILAASYAQQMDGDGRYLVASINKTSDDMEQLVESIQLLSSIPQTSLELNRVNLSELASSIASELQLNEPGRRVSLEVQPDLVATCDPSLAKVALENLLGNAWKYTGLTDAPRIEFGMEQAEGRSLFYVRDNGVGFEMEEAGKLFEPFLRLNNAREYPGTGIGLATVQRVIQLHKGELWGVGEPGRGATFYFSLSGQAPAG